MGMSIKLYGFITQPKSRPLYRWEREAIAAPSFSYVFHVPSHASS
jgi:hypothetical protein